MKHGFTIVELVAGVTAAAVLAITFGVVLVYGYRGWKNLHAMAEMERDATLTMRTISRVLRGAQTNDIRTANDWLIVSNVNGVSEQAFRLSSGRLVYTSNGLAGMNLAQADVAEFSCTPVTDGSLVVRLTLSNEAANVQMSLSNVVTLRN